MGFNLYLLTGHLVNKAAILHESGMAIFLQCMMLTSKDKIT